MILIVLIKLYTLEISEIYSRFHVYLAIQAHDEFESLLVCNVVRFFYLFVGEKFLTSLDSNGVKCGTRFKWDRLM